MKLSICMIVKDEEKNLKRCLNSLVPLMDKIESELIIVDTGSTDRTPDIAKKFTDKVYFHKWNNNFSEMRNISINYAKGQWIFIIDADEKLNSFQEMVAFFNSNKCKKYNAATLLCKNYMNDSEYNTVFLVTPRLFKNNGNFKYTGAVHNMPVYTKPIENLKDILFHYGYITTDKETVEKKFKRTSTMLLKELDKTPDNFYYRYQLSVSYLAHKDYKEALKQIETVYKYIKENKVNKRENFYVYPHFVKCLTVNNDLIRAKEICIEAISVEKEQLDMYCYLGEILMDMHEYDRAIESFSKYLDLVKNYDKLSIANDTMMYVERLHYEEMVYCHLVNIYYKKEEYAQVLKYTKLINSQEIVQKCIPAFLGSFIKLDEHKQLEDYYKNVICNNKNTSNIFCEFLEKVTQKVNYTDLYEFYKILSCGEDKYSILNKFRCANVDGNKLEIDDINNYIEGMDFNNLPEYYGDILYYFIKNHMDFYDYLINTTESNIVKYMLYLNKRDENFINALEQYFNEYSSIDDFKYIKVNKVILEVLMAAGNYEDIKYRSIFLKYLNLGMKYIDYVYSKELIENEWIADVRNNEEGFLVYIKKAFRLKNLNELDYTKYLKKGLEIYPEMNKGIKFLLQDIDDEINKKNDEFENYKKKVKATIKALIDNNKLDEANKIIAEYEEIVKDDLEVVLFKSKISLKKLKNVDTSYKM